MCQLCCKKRTELLVIVWCTGAAYRLCMPAVHVHCESSVSGAYLWDNSRCRCHWAGVPYRRTASVFDWHELHTDVSLYWVCCRSFAGWAWMWQGTTPWHYVTILFLHQWQNSFWQPWFADVGVLNWVLTLPSWHKSSSGSVSSPRSFVASGWFHCFTVELITVDLAMGTAFGL